MKKYIIIALIGILIINIVFINISKNKEWKETSEYLLRFKYAVKQETIEEKEERMRNTQSDIDGLTQYEKLKSGLFPEDNSDTDLDGLTDKEEIEIYHSDPKKASTAEDLYTDSYKIENQMDLFTYYEYDKEIEFLYHKCDEIIFNASTPFYMYAYAENVTKRDYIKGYEILAAYDIHNHSGTLSIDISNLNTKKIGILIQNATDLKIEKCKYKKESNIIHLKKEFDLYTNYTVYIVKKNFFSDITHFINGRLKTLEMPEKPIYFMFGSPLLSDIFNIAPMIYYEDLGNEEENYYFRRDLIKAANFVYGGTDENTNMKAVSKSKVLEGYYIFQKAIPFFDEANKEESVLKELFSYKMDDEFIPQFLFTSFEVWRDMFPFENFGSYISPGGNCAGISYYISYLVNKETFPSSGFYIVNNYEIEWNLNSDIENATLLDEGVRDYKNENFVKDRANENGVILNDKISVGEKEFIKMMGCLWKEANDRIDIDKYTKRKGLSYYENSLLQKIKDNLDGGRVLQLYLISQNGNHAVNICGYYKNDNNNITYLKIYDSNFPNELQIMKIREDYNIGGNQIYYDYFPLSDHPEYRFTSEVPLFQEYGFIILDENWTILN